MDDQCLAEFPVPFRGLRDEFPDIGLLGGYLILKKYRPSGSYGLTGREELIAVYARIFRQIFDLVEEQISLAKRGRCRLYTYPSMTS
jgi:hypothetical protein